MCDISGRRGPHSGRREIQIWDVEKQWRIRGGGMDFRVTSWKNVCMCISITSNMYIIYTRV